jgi:hypothetical protein
MEGQTRTNLNYLEQLYKFHRQQGHPVYKIPQLDKRPIDLYQLRKEVTARGGYHKVRDERLDDFDKALGSSGRELLLQRTTDTSTMF